MLGRVAGAICDYAAVGALSGLTQSRLGERAGVLRLTILFVLPFLERRGAVMRTGRSGKQELTIVSADQLRRIMHPQQGKH